MKALLGNERNVVPSLTPPFYWKSRNKILTSLTIVRRPSAGHLHAVKELLGMDAKINLANKQGSTALSAASR